MKNKSQCGKESCLGQNEKQKVQVWFYLQGTVPSFVLHQLPGVPSPRASPTVTLQSREGCHAPCLPPSCWRMFLSFPQPRV